MRHQPGPQSNHPEALAQVLEGEARRYQAGPQTIANIARLRAGARAVVTGQQVGLFGGPLLTLLKAATAVARATEATKATGLDHVPVFWLATEDHDLAEVDQLALPTKTAIETVSLHLKSTAIGPVGRLQLGPAVEPVLDRVAELLAYAPITERLRAFYTPTATLGEAFARLMTELFRNHGLIVMDASTRAFHALGAPVLRAAIEQAAELETALLTRCTELEQHGYTAQVLVKPNASLLFLISDATTEAGTASERQPLRRIPALRPGEEPTWKAGASTYTTAELLAILEASPERISPNALLRPVMQDAILPTAAYIGGPAEIAYFAQSAVLYQKILGRLTPVLPRLTATLIPPALAELMRVHELTLPDLFTSAQALAQRLGARAMPIETKRRLASVGTAMDTELGLLTDYLTGLDASLGNAARVSASKMLYQINRLRRMAATHELQKQTSLTRHAAALTLLLYPEAHLQERLLGGIWFLATAGESLIDRLVTEAANPCPGHIAISL